MKSNKLLCTILTAITLTTTLAGCSTKTSTSNPGTSEGNKLAEAPLTIYVAGDKPKQQDEVNKYISEQTKSELNIKLDTKYIPWNDYSNQMKLKSAAGENFDIFLSFFSDLPGQISKKAALDITDLITKYGGDLKKNIPEELWKSVTSFDGKIYGIPSVYPMTGMNRGFLVRKDLRVKYNLPEITDIATMEKFFDTIKKNEPSMIPILCANLGMLSADKTLIDHYLYSFGAGLAIDVTQKPYKVISAATAPVNLAIRTENQKAMANGWFEKDFLTDNDRDGKFIQGKAASMPGDLFNITDRQNALSKNVPGAELELAIINKEGKWYGTDPVNNFGVISSTSKNPDRAVMFMNWLRKSKDNWNMYMLGKPGLTYTDSGDKVKVPDGTAPTDKYMPTPWFAQQTNYIKFYDTDPKSYIEALNFWNNLKPEASPLATFVYSNKNVLAEDAAVAKVQKEMGDPITAGIVTDAAQIQKYYDALDKAGLQKLIQDAQTQLDAYMAKQK
jgi:putative aldouronate transport system substrate-binding protein